MFTTLVIGATGGLGGAVALELTRRREPLRILTRDPDKAALRFPDRRRAELIKGDIFDESSMIPALKDVDAIFFGVNFPFSKWESEFPRAAQAVLNAAKHAGAAIIFPGNNFPVGPASKNQYKEDAPNQPCCKKGVIRADIERMLREAAEKSGGRLQVLNVRAADAFGPTIRNPLVDRIFKAAVEKRPIKFIGRLSAPHQWTYAPDLARGTIDLAGMRSKFAPYEVVNFPALTFPKHEQFFHLVAERAGRATLQIETTSWTMIKMAGMIKRETRELLDLQYLFDGGVLLDGGKFKKYAGSFKYTPPELAIDETVVAYRKELEGPAGDDGEEDDE